MKRIVLAACIVLAAACSSSPLANAEGELVVRPERLDFGQTWIGYPAELPVSFTNTGRSRAEIGLAIEAPFEVEQATVALAGGEKRSVLVLFDPPEEGDFEATLLLSDGRSLQVSGSGHVPPDCPPSNLCRQVHFDPATGTCAEERAAEGATCGDACFGGSCVEGECIGSSVSCDDGDVCTVDACDPATGCVHYDDSASCADDVDPCRAPMCDAATGCGFADAPDGTVCGIGDCTTSYVCLQGTCSEVTTPEGGECGSTSPCQDPGVCIAGDCIQDPPFPLEPSWSHEVAPGSALVFDGVTDGAGQVYWAECTFTSCDLVSVTSRGLERYRHTLFVEDVDRAPTGSLALAGDLVISTLAPGRIEARSVTTGQQVWSRDLLPAVESAPAAAVAQRLGTTSRWVDEAAPPVIAADVILVAVEGYDDGGPWGGWVVALARASGEVRWVWSGGGVFEGLVGDEGGSVYFGLRQHDAGPTDGGLLVSLGTTGAERWRLSTPFQAPLATLGGVLLQATGDLRTAADGLSHAVLPVLVPTWPRRTPLIASRSLYTVGVPLVPCDTGVCPTWVPHLFRFEYDSGLEIWRQELPSGQISQPTLTSDLSILYAWPQPFTSGEAWLTEVAADSSVVFECQLPSGGRYDGASTLHVGQWITADTANGAVMAFGVQKRAAPPAGWISAGGSPERTARPR